MIFKDLHSQKHPLLIANVWDVPSARVAERLGFQAIGTSSSAIAQLLGYSDGEEMSFSELEYMVQRIASSTQIPLTVDLEAGYSREPQKIVHHIGRLNAHGVVGINLEDSIVVDGQRKLLNSSDFAHTLAEILHGLKEAEIDVFVNVRTDTFILLEEALGKTLERAEKYTDEGADGIFVPCITDEMEIKELVESTILPINVMCMPQLPDFETLERIGVKRISMGNFLFDHMYQQYEQTLGMVQSSKSFKNVF